MDQDEFSKEGFTKILIRLEVLEDRIAYLEAERGQFTESRTVIGQENEDAEEEFSDVNISLKGLQWFCYSQ